MELKTSSPQISSARASRILLQEIDDLFIHDLVEDLDEAIALLKVLGEFFGRNLIHRRQGLNALRDFFLGNFDVFLLGNSLQKESDLDSFLCAMSCGGVNLLFLLLDRFARNAALRVFLNDVIDYIARLLCHRSLRQLEIDALQ